MKKAIATFVLAGGLAMTGLPALAETPPAQEQAQKAQLEQRSKQLARELHRKKGAVPRSEIMRQRRAIEDLIRRLEAGEEVAPGEVDRLLKAR